MTRISVEAFGDSRWDAGADDARHEGSGDAADRRVDRKGAGAAQRRCALERMRGEVAEMANEFPLYAWRRRRRRWLHKGSSQLSVIGGQTSAGAEPQSFNGCFGTTKVMRC